MTDHITKLREAISAWDANATSKRAKGGGNEAVIEYMKRAAAWEAFLTDHFKVDAARSLLAALDEAHSELAEQARLVGMGVERELALMARLDEAQKDAEKRGHAYQALTKVAANTTAVRELLETLDKANAARRQAQEECVELKARLASQRVELMRELRGPMVQVEKDARRYRWLRRSENAKQDREREDLVKAYGDHYLDQAIDAAIASQEWGRYA